jgi:hypothetical protein
MHPLDFMVPIERYSASVRDQARTSKDATTVVIDVEESPDADIGLGVAFSQRPSAAEVEKLGFGSQIVEEKVVTALDDF